MQAYGKLTAVPLSALRPLEFRQVRRTPEERLFNSLLEQYHPLGCLQPVDSVPFCYTSLTL